MKKIILKTKVTPRSSRNEITSWRNEILGIKLTAPPIDGAANKSCIKFLADQLGVKKSDITLVSGHTSRDKTFKISGLNHDELNQRLAKHSIPDTVK